MKALDQFILATVVLSILGFGFWLAYEPWFKLSKDFGSLIDPPNVFIERQSCILDKTIIKGYINVGITEQKLYLSHTPPPNYFIHPLLIDLDAITKIEFLDSAPVLRRAYKFYIGEPHITTLILSQKLIEQLEEEYGEPIFSDKLI